MSLRALIVGAAAGGGLPQWNCNGPNSATFWRGNTPLTAMTQSSLAVSADGAVWALLNASPDIRHQIMATPQLQPRNPEVYGLRDTPIRSVLLTNGDIDHVAGLLTLREKQAFDLLMTPEIAAVIARRFGSSKIAFQTLSNSPTPLSTKKSRSRLTITGWLALASNGDFHPLAVALVEAHYDPAYDRARKRDGAEWTERVLETASLDHAALSDLADQICERETV